MRESGTRPDIVIGWMAINPLGKTIQERNKLFRGEISSEELKRTRDKWRAPLRTEISNVITNIRYYCLDGCGHPHSAEWFAADSDEEAVTQIEADHPDGKCEIWQGTRLVAKTKPKRLQA